MKKSNQKNKISSNVLPNRKKSAITGDMQDTFTWDKLGQWIVVALVLLLYLRVFSNGLTNRDDESYILLNPFIRFFDPETIRINFTLYYMGNYHPFSMLCLALGYQLGGTLAWPYQLINLALHLGNTLLVYHFVKALLHRSSGSAVNIDTIAAVTALLFGVHTLQVESVAWVSENKNVLYTFFFLLALVQYLNYIKSGRWKSFMLTMLFFLFSLFSKAMAVTLPLCMLAVDYFTGRMLFSKRVVLEKIPFFALSAVFGVIALYAQDTAINMEEAGSQLGVFGRITVACYGLVQYLLKLLLPVHLSAFYEYPVINENRLPVGFYVYPVIVSIFFIFLVWKIRKYPVYLFTIMFFLFNIFPVLQLLPVGNAMLADRYIYVPSIGFFLLFAFLFNSIHQRAGNKKWILSVLFGFYVTCLISLTFFRIGTWKDSETLWNDVLAKGGFQRHSGAWYVRAGLNNDAGRYKEALNDIAIYLEAHPDNGDAYFQRAFARLSLDDLKGAVEDLDRSEQLGVKDARVFNNRGFVKNKMGDYSGAIMDFNRSLEMNSGITDAYKGRADAHLMLENYQHALKDLAKVLETEPSNAEVYNNMGAIKIKQGDYTGAMADLNKAISLKRDFMEALQNRVDAKYNLEDYQGVISDLSSIISFEPVAYAYYYRGKAYLQLGMRKEACTDFSQALQLGYVMMDQFVVDSCGNF